MEEFVETFPAFVEGLKKQQLLKAEEICIPYIVTNAVKIAEQRVSHFFKSKEKGDGGLSMYGSPGLCSGSCERSDFANRWKCEKHSLVATMSFYTNARHRPFDEIFLFVKIATDGRPGTEVTRFTFDRDDSSFGGFLKDVGGFKHATDYPCVNEIDIAHTYNPSGGYPRVYISMRYKYSPLLDVLKFYCIPSMLFVLMVIEKLDSGSLIKLGSALILGDIALLFVQKGNVMTYGEQTVVANTLLLISGTVMLSKSAIETALLPHVGMMMLVVVCSFNFILLVAHFCQARVHNARIVKLIEKNEFAVLGAL